uniref:Uncharacterized protein n=2 Tax=Ditylum brightwellii TaxID=49249 RepID=A0A7S4T3T0_9STRA
MSCSRGNFINSFFTYDGADTLLDAVGKYPSVFYECDINEQCDAGYYRSSYANGYYMSNADCVTSGGGFMSSTMGCSRGGKFAMAEFTGQSCRGTDFFDIVDPMHSYNRQMNHVGCSQVWSRGSDTSSALETLLKNSWSCDVNLYPDTCPDPYGKKVRYDYALRAVAHGQNPTTAIVNMRLKLPLRILGSLLFIGGILLRFLGYYIHKRERIRGNGGGLRGILRVLSDDNEAYRKKLAERRLEAQMLAAQNIHKSVDKTENKKHKKKTSPKKSKREGKREGRREGKRESRREGKRDKKRERSKEKMHSFSSRSGSYSEGWDIESTPSPGDYVGI